ncbi:MAG: hypothetical protein ABI678_14505 [Kofleriaceae bacterium]
MKWLFVLVLASTPAFAQAPGQTPPIKTAPTVQSRDVDPPPARETKRDRVKKRIRAMRAYALTTELGLEADDAGRLFPVLQKFDDDFDRLLVTRTQLQRKLDDPSGMTAKAIDKLIDQSLANQRDFWNLEEKRIAELRKILTPPQVARLLVVLPALERRITNQLRKAAKPAGGRRGADGDADDDVEPNERPVKPPRGNPTPTRPER